jgi:hypothetical protein
MGSVIIDDIDRVHSVSEGEALQTKLIRLIIKTCSLSR